MQQATLRNYQQETNLIVQVWQSRSCNNLTGAKIDWLNGLAATQEGIIPDGAEDFNTTGVNRERCNSWRFNFQTTTETLLSDEFGSNKLTEASDEVAKQITLTL